MKAKRFLSLLLAMALMFCAAEGLLQTKASAGYSEFTVKEGKVGEYYDQCIWQVEDDTIGGIKDVANLPAGMSFYTQSDAIFLRGTPTAAGSYTIMGSVWYTDGYEDEDLVINLKINPADKEKKTVSKTYDMTAGTYFSATVYESTVGRLDAINQSWQGLTLKTSSNALKVTLEGTPQSSGTHTFNVTVDEEYVCDVTFNITVKVAEPAAAFQVTKSPTAEYAVEGEKALFIAAAENYSSVEWMVNSKDCKEIYTGKDAIEKAFPGVKVSLYKDSSGRECMHLTELPLSINGYYVQAKFWNSDKSQSKTTDTALLTVKEATLQAPTISGQSADVELKSGETVTLAVDAKSPDGNTLKYQWYKNNANSNSGGEAIPGATSTSYTPKEDLGSVWYYCSVTNTKGEKTSASVVSKAIEVYYKAAEEPVAEAEEPAEAEVPAEEPDVAAEEPAADTETDTEKDAKKDSKKDSKTDTAAEEDDEVETIEAATKAEKKDHTALFVIAGIVVVAMICGTVIYLNLRKKNDEE